jgi:hypothetical protein
LKFSACQEKCAQQVASGRRHQTLSWRLPDLSHSVSQIRAGLENRDANGILFSHDPDQFGSAPTGNDAYLGPPGFSQGLARALILKQALDRGVRLFRRPSQSCG